MSITKAEAISKMAEYQRRRPVYKFCCVEIVGNVDEWGYAYYVDEGEYYSPKKAHKAGIKELEHDDFIVAEFKEDACTAVYLRAGTKREETHHYIKGINKELGT
jgi:hypothetical protein